MRAVKAITQCDREWGEGPPGVGGQGLRTDTLGVGRTPEEKHFWTEGLVPTQAPTSLICLRVRKRGTSGWTPLVRTKETMKLGGDQGFGTLGRNFDYEQREAVGK